MISAFLGTLTAYLWIHFYKMYRIKQNQKKFIKALNKFMDPGLMIDETFKLHKENMARHKELN